jgi:hypothetical protein
MSDRWLGKDGGGGVIDYFFKFLLPFLLEQSEEN